MHKTAGLFMASTLLFNSVLVPLVANAQTVQGSVSTTSANIESMTTAPVSSVQDSASATTPSFIPTSLLPLSGSEPTSLTSYTVTLTSYNAVPSQTSPTPWLTASGALSNPQVIAARSWGLAKELPFGTIIEVDGPSSSDPGPYCGYDAVSNLIGYRVIADTTNARFIAPRIDIQLDQNEKIEYNGQLMNPSVALGACKGVQIKVVGYVDPSHIPQTQAELAALVQSDQNLAYAKF